MGKGLKIIIGAISAVVGATAIGAALSDKNEKKESKKQRRDPTRNADKSQDAPYQSISGLPYQDGIQTDERWRKKKTKREPQSERSQVKQSSTIQEKKCAFCNGIIDLSARFCRFCGNATIEQKRFCASCGAMLESDSRFCLECGEKV